MTQADSAKALRRSLDSQAGGHATTSPRLPGGWTAFQSVEDSGDPGRWYATAPYDAVPVAQRAGKQGARLFQTVSAGTWDKLCEEVEAQIDLYEKLTEA